MSAFSSTDKCLHLRGRKNLPLKPTGKLRRRNRHLSENNPCSVIEYDNGLKYMKGQLGGDQVATIPGYWVKTECAQNTEHILCTRKKS